MGMRMAACALCALVLLTSACSDTEVSEPEGGIQVHVLVKVPLQNGNLVQLVLRPGSVATALCYVSADRVPAGYPGSTVRVRSGGTVGYAAVEADGHDAFDVSAPKLQKALPGCPDVGLQ